MFTTRIAPSPTGMMHVGTARTALFNWLSAKAYGGVMLLRIDDTDASRNQPEMVQPILDGLEWLGLDYDEVFYQSDRLGLYQNHAEVLLSRGFATEADNGAILLKLLDWMPRQWVDQVAGPQRINDEELKHIDGLVLLRGDGSPTYHFASTVDDYEMGVDYIIRGDDHRVNTGKHIAIWTALDHLSRSRTLFPMCAHVGLIHKDGRKMSKRDGAASLLDYRDAGIDPDAMAAFLLRLGWGPTVDNKANSLILRDRAIGMFLTEGKMKAKPANFDEVMLRSIDRKVKAMKEKA